MESGASVANLMLQNGIGCRRQQFNNLLYEDTIPQIVISQSVCTDTNEGTPYVPQISPWVVVSFAGVALV